MIAIFILYANKTGLALRQREPITSGSVNVYPVQFQFSGDWDGLTRTAVFRAGPASASILLEDSGACSIPWEVLTAPGRTLLAGVYGVRGEDLVLPTVWAKLGMILEGASPGDAARPPTPELWQQVLAGKGDRLDYTPDGELGLYARDRLLSSAPVSGSGANWGIGHGLAVKDGKLTVVTVNDFSGDNTLPITAAGVQTSIGNIEALLGTI